MSDASQLLVADTKISAAADIVSLVSTDMVPVARSADTTAYHATMAEIATWANTNLPTASTTTAGVVKVDGSTITIASGVISGVSPAPYGSLPAMDGTANAGAVSAWSRGDHVHPTDSSRAPLVSPAMTGTPTAPTPTTGDNSTKLATTAFVQAQMVASGAGVSSWNSRAGAVVLQQSDLVAQGGFHDTGRNLVMNGAFAVAQRGAGPWTTSGTHTADRWITYVSLDTINASLTAISDTGRSQIGDESARIQFAISVTGNAGAAAQTVLSQAVEGVSRLANKTVTLSFYAAGSASLKLGASLDQVFGTGGSPSATVSGNGQSVTISSATFARYTLTFTLSSMAGKTLGTNNDDKTWLNLWFSSGSTNATRSGGVGVQSGSFYLYGIQLEIGSVMTPFDAGGTPQQQLAACQRFYQVGFVSMCASGVASQWLEYSVKHPVQMRATPSIAYSGSAYTNCSGMFAQYVTTDSFGCGALATANGLTAFTSSYTASADL